MSLCNVIITFLKSTKVIQGISYDSARELDFTFKGKKL